MSQTGRIGNLSHFNPNYVEGTLATGTLTKYIAAMYEFVSICASKLCLYYIITLVEISSRFGSSKYQYRKFTCRLSLS